MLCRRCVSSDIILAPFLLWLWYAVSVVLAILSLAFRGSHFLVRGLLEELYGLFFSLFSPFPRVLLEVCSLLFKSADPQITANDDVL